MKRLTALIKRHKAAIAFIIAVIALVLLIDFDGESMIQIYQMIFGSPDDTP